MVQKTLTASLAEYGMTSTITKPFSVKKVSKTYANITYPSFYAKIDSYSGLGIDSDKYDLMSYIIKGWSGTLPIEITKGSNGTDIYVMGFSDKGTTASMTVEYFFMSK